MDIDVFIKNWKDELRSEAKKRPGIQSISIVQVDPKEDSELLKRCKEIGIVGFIYKIPIDSGINTKKLKNLLAQAESETEMVFLELPVPDFIDLEEIDSKYYKLPIGKGVVAFLKSQNIEGELIEILVNEGYKVKVGDVEIDEVHVRELGYCALMEECLCSSTLD